MKYCSTEQIFIKNSENSQENTCVGVSFYPQNCRPQPFFYRASLAAAFETIKLIVTFSKC